MSKEIEFVSSYFLRIFKRDFHPFTPNTININTERIEFRRRNWYLITEDTETLYFKNITGITIDNHLFGSTIKIKSTGNDPIFVHGFWKSKANEIKNICSKFISATSLNHDREAESSNPSAAGELYKLNILLETGVITMKEFEQLKRKTLKD